MPARVSEVLRLMPKADEPLAQKAHPPLAGNPAPSALGRNRVWANFTRRSSYGGGPSPTAVAPKNPMSLEREPNHSMSAFETEISPEKEAWYEEIARKKAVYVEYETVRLGDSTGPEKEPAAIDLIGVRHTPATLVQHYQELADRIEASSQVVVEYFNVPGETDNLRGADPGAIAEKIAAAEGDLKDATVQTLFENRTHHSAEQFFGAIGGMAARKGKDIVVINPENTAAESMTAIGSSTAGAGFLILAGYLHKKLKEAQDQPAGSEGAKISRRKFLRGMAGTAAVATLAYAGVSTHQEYQYEKAAEEKIKSTVQKLTEQLEKNGVIQKESSEDVKLEKLQWCLNDWRDASTALGLQHLAKAGQTPKGAEPDESAPGLLIQGIGHEHTLAYLRDPEAARKRLEYYNLTFNTVGRSTIRRYRFDEQHKRISLISEEPYA